MHSGKRFRAPFMHGPNFDRRALLARMSAAPVIAPSADAAQEDSIFEHLDEDALARKAYFKAHARYRELEARWRETIAETAPPFIVLKDGTKAATFEEISNCFNLADPTRKYERAAAIYKALLRVPGRVDGGAPEPPTREAKRAFRREVRDAEAQLTLALAKHEKARERCGLAAAEARYEQCLAAAIVAERAVMVTPPTTLPGAIALLRYLRVYMESQRGDADNVLPALANVEAFLSRRHASEEDGDEA